MTIDDIHTLEPLAEIEIDPPIARLPKADIHIHGEWLARLDRVLARREQRQPYNWRDWVRKVMQEPRGLPRFAHLSRFNMIPEELDFIPENTIARMEDLLEESAQDGSILVEVRFGNMMLRPNYMAIFREAERRVQSRHPNFHAETIAFLYMGHDPELLERMVQACIDLQPQGLHGVDFLSSPYATEADWTLPYRIAQRLSDAGLGITDHAGEFSTANIESALNMPGLSRLGHATYAAKDQRLIELIGEKNVTIECSMSCNVVLGAAPSYAAHPIRQFVEAGLSVAVCTDDPVQVCTTIGREYAIAHKLGFSEADLVGFTRNAIQAVFTSDERRRELLNVVDGWNIEM